MVSLAGEVLLTSDRFRDQGRNVEDCLAKLREMIQEVWLPPRARKKTKPTKSSVRKRLEGKRIKSDRKQGRGKIQW